MTAEVLGDRTTRLYAKFSARLTPRGSVWIGVESQRLRDGTLDPANVMSEAQQACTFAIFSCNGDPDIAAVAFIVLMQATSDMDQDLKAIMDSLKQGNSAKASMRGAMRPVGVVSAQQIDQDVDKMKNDLDSLSEMGEPELLRLQMSMDRLSKFTVILSNIAKRISDTDRSIQNKN